MNFLSSDTLERTLTTTNFGQSVVVAIADLIDGVGGSCSCSEGRDKKQDQQHQHRQEGGSNENYDYNPTYWLGGDCWNAVTSSSLATIVECATMKTANTTAASTAVSAAIVSPCNSKTIDRSNKTKDTRSTIVVSHQQQKQHQGSQKEEEHDDGDDYEDDNRSHYISPSNSIISEEEMQQDFIDDNNSNSNSNIHSEYFRKYKYNQNRAGKNKINIGKNNSSSNSNNSYGAEDKDWFSASPASSSSWCGGVPTILFYNQSLEEEVGIKEPVSDQHQHKEKFVYNNYYAEYKPHRQYAFDEGDADDDSGDVDANTDNDGQYTVGTTTTTGQTTDDDDGNSVRTGFTSIQSFMMINHPHKTASQMQMMRQSQLSSSSSSSSTKITMPNRYHTHKMMDTSFSSATYRVEPSALSPTPTHLYQHKDDNNSNEEQEKGEGVNNPSEYALTQYFMRKLQRYLPFSKRGDSFWLQYSLVRDGASLDSLLDMIQPQQVDLNNNVCSVLAIETLEGEIFGAFVTQSWRRSNNQWYGGGQSFLWTTTTKSYNNDDNRKDKKNRRRNNSNSLEVYTYSFANSYVQLCDNDRLLVGAGDDGFGIAIERDLFTGSSNPCTTFSSPSLSKLHSDGSTFEIRNLEIWTLTPCLSMVENKSKGLTRVHSKDTKIKNKNTVTNTRSDSNNAKQHHHQYLDNRGSGASPGESIYTTRI